MQEHNARNEKEVARIVALSNQDPSASGPVVIKIHLWDGREMIASYYHGKEKWNTPDAETRRDHFMDWSVMEPLITALLNGGTSFVTMTGTDDQFCALEWALSS